MSYALSLAERRAILRDQLDIREAQITLRDARGVLMLAARTADEKHINQAHVALLNSVAALEDAINFFSGAEVFEHDIHHPSFDFDAAREAREERQDQERDELAIRRAERGQP